MKQSELNQILREIITEELANENYPTHTEWDAEHGDGYSNEFQHAFAHSQVTTPRHDDTKKAIELAKQGKFVVVVTDDVHCKSTDAVLGQCVSIHKVYDNINDAQTEAEKLHQSGQDVNLITPASVSDKGKTKLIPPSEGDDVPFQESKKLSRLEKLKARRDPDGIEEQQSVGGKPQWTGNMRAALQELDSRMKKENDPNFENKLLDVQMQWGLDDYQTYLVGENSTYPTTPDLWKTLANGKFAKFVQMDEVNHTTDDQGKSQIAVGAPNSLARFIVEHPGLIEQMRDWVKECSWGERFEEEEIDELTPEQLIQGVQRHYEGGLKQFMIDANPSTKTESKTFREIRNELDPDGEKHDLTLTCEKCGTTETCRCSQPKRKFKGICDKCSSQNEGYGYVHDKDMAKDPKHIKGERWRIKFQSSKDLKKHGNTEKSTVNEGKRISPQDMTKALDILRKKNPAGYSQMLLLPFGPVPSYAWEDPNNEWWSSEEAINRYNDVRQGASMGIKKEIAPTISLKEFRSIVKELINEMWVGWEEDKNIKEGMTPGQPIPKDVNKISQLIFSLKEGEYIWFSFDQAGQSGHGYGVEKKIEGDEFVYRTTGEYGEYLEQDEDVEKFAQNVLNDKYAHYYFIGPIQGYQKSSRSSWNGDDDQQPGHYELYGPDRPDWREMYEAKGMTPKDKLRNIIRETLGEVMRARDMGDDHSSEEAREVEIGKEIKNLADAIIIGDAQHDPYLKHKARIVKLADELIAMHKHGKDVPIKGRVNPGLNEKAPAGWEGTVKAMKKDSSVDNPFALAHWMKNKGYKSHK